MTAFREPLVYIGPDEGPSDEALAVVASAGDMRALEELFHRYEPPLVKYLWRLVRDRDTARDLFQDTFFRAWVNFSAYDSRRPFRPWLYRIATNIGLDHLRHRARALPPAGDERSRLSVEGEVIARDLARRVEEAVTQLPEDQRMVFVLRHYQQLNYAEISHICGSPEGTVRSRMHYALRVLREKLHYLVEESEVG